MKKVKGKPDKINELILKTNANLKEGPGKMIVMLGLCFLLIDWLSFEEGGGVRLKLDVQCQEGGRILDVDGQGVKWGGGLENWTIFMDVTCVSSLY